jgi:hypothetical protein
MNSKFLGNSLDLYKFSVITHLMQCSKGTGLFYVPMITEPLPKERTPKYSTYELGCGHKELFKLMKKEFKKEFSEINVIKKYFIKSGIHLSMLSVDDESNPKERVLYFCEENRKIYFDLAIQHYKSLVNNTLVFIDPDIGCDVGITRRFRSYRQSYLKKTEIINIMHHLKRNDFIGYFQHLGNSNYSIDQRVKDLRESFGEWVLFIGYSRIQASLVFIFNDEATYMDKRKLIEQYYEQHNHLKHRDKFIIQGKPLKSSGFLAL